MPFNGSGVYTRTDGTRTGATTWNKAKLAAAKINAADHDTHDEDLATAINGSLQKNGENAMTAALDLGGYKISNYGNTDSVDGVICEKLNSDVFTAHIKDADDLAMASGEYTLRDAWSQTTGDRVDFWVKMVFTTITTTLNTDSIYLDITNSGGLNVYPDDGDEPTNFYWPCHVYATGALNTITSAYVYSDGSSSIRVALNKLTGDPAVASSNNVAPTSGDTLFVSGSYKVSDNAITIPST